jgi:hypothetical protein
MTFSECIWTSNENVLAILPRNKCVHIIFNYSNCDFLALSSVPFTGVVFLTTSPLYHTVLFDGILWLHTNDVLDMYLQWVWACYWHSTIVHSALIRWSSRQLVISLRHIHLHLTALFRMAYSAEGVRKLMFGHIWDFYSPRNPRRPFMPSTTNDWWPDMGE